MYKDTTITAFTKNISGTKDNRCYVLTGIPVVLVSVFLKTPPPLLISKIASAQKMNCCGVLYLFMFVTVKVFIV